MAEENIPSAHPDDQLSVEINFRSFLAGEGQEFFTPVPVEHLRSLASVGTPITIPAGAPYTHEELCLIAETVQKGGNTLTLLGGATYDSVLLERLNALAPGHVRLA
jgi:hypothetical protein